MKGDTYSVLMVWSDEDEAFVAKVLELPGCMAHGETRAETIEHIGIAIENWLETARELGRQIPSPKHLADYEKELELVSDEQKKRRHSPQFFLLSVVTPEAARVASLCPSS